MTARRPELLKLRQCEPTPKWFERAACANHPELDFFPPRGAIQNEQKYVCWNECPVRLRCLNYAIDHGEKYGIWGGESERGRRGMRLQKKRAKEAAA